MSSGPTPDTTRVPRDPFALSDPKTREARNKTFMGGIPFSTRVRLFVGLALSALAVAGVGYYAADRQLTAAEDRLSRAQDLGRLAATVKQGIRNLRNEERDYLLGKGREVADNHQATVDSVGAALESLSGNSEAGPVRDNIATIGEGIAQYAKEFGAIVAMDRSLGVTDAGGLAGDLKKSATALQDRLAKARQPALGEVMALMRQYEKDFILHGTRRELVKIKDGYGEFNRRLATRPLTPQDKTEIADLMKSYQTTLTAFAARKLARQKSVRRIDEIFSYIGPSVSGLIRFARGELAAAAAGLEELRGYLRLLIPAGSALVLLVVMAIGYVLMRSMARPTRALSEATAKLAAGEDEVFIPALGNGDEMGDLARALTALRGKLGQAMRLQKDLVITREQVEKGETAMAEVARLRDELARANAELRKGAAAVVETAVLREDLETARAEARRAAGLEAELARLRGELAEARAEIESGAAAVTEAARLREELVAARDELDRRQSEGEAEPAPEPAERPAARAPERPESQPESAPEDVAALSGPLSSLGEKVARSSQSVTAAAYEAERTGALIRGLADAAGKIAEVEILLASITEQTSMLVFPHRPRPDAAPEGAPNLVVFERRGEERKQPGEESVGKRFDSIRSTASQATWAVKDIAKTIGDIRDIAAEIASATSSEALAITTELLAQSENLRGMLDSLVHKIQGTPETWESEAGEGAKRRPSQES